MRQVPIEKTRFVQEDLKDLFEDVGGDDYQDSSLDILISNDPQNTIVNGLTGGAYLKGIEYELFIKNEGSKSISIPQNVDPINIELNLSKWLDGTGLIINKTPIKRRVLISYIANKKGGKHIDNGRGISNKDNICRILDERLEIFVLKDKSNAAYLELHAMIQSLMNSKKIQKFLDYE
ncbi:MAG: hypothetical protein V1783_09890 [Bacteroidota bacterium]